VPKNRIDGITDVSLQTSSSVGSDAHDGVLKFHCGRAGNIDNGWPLIDVRSTEPIYLTASIDE
jgi:hypothetical protein